ncbi:MAG: hypothetical protein KDD47_25975, partial [Acidobacteria bacterium]|nr:hypothetical protein [Acidobacteriota bacterium]
MRSKSLFRFASLCLVVASVTFSSAEASGTGDPCPGWDGWVAWDDFAPDGTFCVPATRDALPEPI